MMADVHNPDIRIDTGDHTLHDPHVFIPGTEIAEQGNQRSSD
jgi:hypothetical protein